MEFRILIIICLPKNLDLSRSRELGSFNHWPLPRKCILTTMPFLDSNLQI